MNFWQTEHIRLRGLEPTDAVLLHEFNQDTEISRQLDWLWPPYSLAGVAQWVTFNEPSIQLHEQLGFQLEGRLRHTLYTNGRHHDQLFYGMTKEEFQAKQG